MKYLAYIIAIACSFAFASGSLADPKAKDAKTAKTAPVGEPKVSKKDAEHAVLFQYRGANIEHIQAIQGKDHPNWLVDVFQAGARSATQVQVDGVTGKIIEGDAKSTATSSKTAPSRKGGMGY